MQNHQKTLLGMFATRDYDYILLLQSMDETRRDKDEISA